MNEGLAKKVGALISRRVALKQGSLLLHQPGPIMRYSRLPAEGLPSMTRVSAKSAMLEMYNTRAAQDDYRRWSSSLFVDHTGFISGRTSIRYLSNAATSALSMASSSR
jgi:hypothetical protein